MSPNWLEEVELLSACRRGRICCGERESSPVSRNEHQALQARKGGLLLFLALEHKRRAEKDAHNPGPISISLMRIMHRAQLHQSFADHGAQPGIFAELFPQNLFLYCALPLRLPAPPSFQSAAGRALGRN